MTTITVPRLPIVSYHSPEQFELEMQLRMRLFKAAGLDAPEAIAEVQRIAAEQAGMVNVTEAADAIIEDLPSINAALMRAKKEAKRATPEALAAKAAKEAAKEAAKAEAAAVKAAKKVKAEELEDIVQQALDEYNLPAAVSSERAAAVEPFVNSTLQSKGMDRVGRPRLLAALGTLRDSQK
jgi:hypothetical protein